MIPLQFPTSYFSLNCCLEIRRGKKERSSRYFSKYLDSRKLIKKKSEKRKIFSSNLHFNDGQNFNRNINLTNGKKGKAWKIVFSFQKHEGNEDSTRGKGRNNQATVLYIKILNGHKCRPSFNSSPNPVSPLEHWHVPRLISSRDAISALSRCANNSAQKSFPSFSKRRLNEGGSMPLKIPSPPGFYVTENVAFLYSTKIWIPDLFVTGQLGINCALELNEFQLLESFGSISMFLRHLGYQFIRVIFFYGITFSNQFSKLRRDFSTTIFFSRRLGFFFFYYWLSLQFNYWIEAALYS